MVSENRRTHKRSKRSAHFLREIPKYAHRILLQLFTWQPLSHVYYTTFDRQRVPTLIALNSSSYDMIIGLSIDRCTDLLQKFRVIVLNQPERFIDCSRYPSSNHLQVLSDRSLIRTLIYHKTQINNGRKSSF